MKYLLCTGIVLLIAASLKSQHRFIADVVNAESRTENRAAELLANELKTLGFEVKEDIGITGVVAIYKNGTGPVVMYRADMDCNAVKETTGLPYARSNFTAMHACGDNDHLNWIIGVAAMMIRSKDQWKGTLIVIGEPAEEKLMAVETMSNNEMYSSHSDPQPHYVVAMNTTPVSVGLMGADKTTQLLRTLQKTASFATGCNSLETVDCHHLQLHDTRKDYCHIEVGGIDGHQVELAAIPFGVRNGTNALLEIFKWATASR